MSIDLYNNVSLINSQLNGNIMKYVKDNDKNGIEIEYLEKQTEYKYGKKNGLELEFYKNMNIKKKCFYLTDKIHGKLTEYYENGYPQKIIEYCYGLKNGNYKEWFNNGSLRIDCFYNVGILDKKYKEYLLNGKLLYDIDYKNGEIILYNSNKIYSKLYTHGYLKKSKYNIQHYHNTYSNNIYNQNLYMFPDKIIYYPSSYKIKSKITYFKDGTVNEKINYNLIGQLDGIQILWNIYNDEKYIKKRVRYKDGKIISTFNDTELIFKNNKNISVISPPYKDLIGWIICTSNDIFNIPLIVKLLIPKEAHRLLFIDDNKNLFRSRAEFAIVQDIYPISNLKNNTFTEAKTYMNTTVKKTIYKVGVQNISYSYDNNINNINGEGIYYNIHYGDLLI